MNRTANFSVNPLVAGSNPGWGAELINDFAQLQCWALSFLQIFVPKTIEQFIQIVDSYIHWYNEKQIKISLG